MRKVIDVVLIAAVLGAAGYGAYHLGKAIIHTGNTYGAAASGTSTTPDTTTTTIAQPATKAKRTHENRRKILLGIFVVGCMFAVLILMSVLGSFRRYRRRQGRLERWQV